MPQSTPYGPFCTAAGQLTREGQRMLTEWLTRWPEPCRALAKFYPALYAVASRRYDWEELDALCKAGGCKAMQRFDPSRGLLFQSYAIPWMRAEVGRALRSANKSERYGYYVNSGESTDSDECSFSMAMIASHDDDTHDQSEYLRRRIVEILKRNVPSFKYRQMFMMKYGLGGLDAMTMAEVGDVMDLSRQCVQQTLLKVRAKIMPDLADLYADHVR